MCAHKRLLQRRFGATAFFIDAGIPWSVPDMGVNMEQGEA